MAEEERQIVTADSPEVQEAMRIFNEMHSPQSDTVMDSNQKTTVMMSLISAITSDDKFQYRQTLRTASFADAKQSWLSAMAISECERYGAPISPLINLIEAQNGERGPHGVRPMALEALTHTTFSTNNNRNQNKARDKSKPIG